MQRQAPDGVVEKVIANGDPPPSSELDLGVRGVLRRLRSFDVMPGCRFERAFGASLCERL